MESFAGNKHCKTFSNLSGVNVKGLFLNSRLYGEKRFLSEFEGL
jgi:hypothetical protein